MSASRERSPLGPRRDPSEDRGRGRPTASVLRQASGGAQARFGPSNPNGPFRGHDEGDSPVRIMLDVESGVRTYLTLDNGPSRGHPQLSAISGEPTAISGQHRPTNGPSRGPSTSTSTNAPRPNCSQLPAAAATQLSEPEPMDVAASPATRRPRSDENAAAAGPAASYAETSKRAKLSPDSPPSSASAAAPPAAPAATTTTPPGNGKGKGSLRYPPLIVENLPNWTLHVRALKAKLGFAPNAHVFGGKGFKFLPKSEVEYRSVQRYLTELEKTERISWFSYSLPSERSVKVAIRGLPADTDVTDIQSELEALEFTPEYIRPIKARQGRAGCLFLAILKKTPNLPNIYNVRELLALPNIKIELWRGRKGPAQCHRCQQFRHSSHNCHRTLACVRCGEQHTARECPRPREEPATCANCSGPHPANHTACPIFRREARNKKAGTVALTPRHNIVEADGDSPNLMAAANNAPTGSRPGRKNKKRGGKKKRKGQSAPSPPTPAALSHTPAAETADSGKSTRASASAQASKPVAARPAQSTGKAAAGKKPTQTISPSSDGGSMDLSAFVQMMHKVLAAHKKGEDITPLLMASFLTHFG